MDDLESAEQRRARHRAWLAGLGLSAADWRRIRRLAGEVSPTGYSPPALTDLSVPLRVAALAPQPRYRLGGLMGVVTQPDGRKVALVCTPMDDNELTRHWPERRRRRLEAGLD